MGVSFIPRSGARASNVTVGLISGVLGFTTPVGVGTLTSEALTNLGNIWDFSNVQSPTIDLSGSDGSGGEFNNAITLSFVGVFTNAFIVLNNCTNLPAPINGIISYTAQGTTSTTTFPALPSICPATLDLHGLTPTKIVSINWSAVTNFSGTTVNINLSGQALTSAETSEAVQVAATAGAGNLATMTINVSGGTNGPLLQPVSDLTVSLGGMAYEANDPVFVNAIQVGVVNSVGGGGDIIDFTLNSPNAFLNTSGTVTVTSTSGTGAVITVNTLGTNIYAASITGAGGTVTSN